MNFYGGSYVPLALDHFGMTGVQGWNWREPPADWSPVADLPPENCSRCRVRINPRQSPSSR